jgi:hypothetical protein
MLSRPVLGFVTKSVGVGTTGGVALRSNRATTNVDGVD